MQRYLQSISPALRYVLLFVAVIPLFLLRDVTLDNELRYLSIADEALREGHFMTFYNHGAAYADKPPLYLWIVMLGRTLFGAGAPGAGFMAFISLFSVIPALVILGIMDRWVRPFVADVRARIAGQLMLYTSVYFIGAAVVLRMDMLMCMFITLALYTFWRLYSGSSAERGHTCRDRMLFPVYVFLAVFSKGPVGILVPLVTVIVFLLIKGDWRKIGYYWGLQTWGILLGLCAVWFAGVYIEGGNAYLDNLLFNQTVNRAVDSFHHKAPFWYYGVSIWYSLAPWSLLVIGVLIAGLCRWRRMVTTDLERLFLVAALSTLIMLSLISSKIQIYLLPAFPFFVYIAVLWIAKGAGEVKLWMKWLLGVPAGVLGLVFPSILLGFIIRQFPSSGPDMPFVIAAAALISAGGIACLVFLRRNSLNRGITCLATGLLAGIFTLSFAVPHNNDMIGMGKVCAAAKEAGDAEGIRDYYTYDIKRAENIDVYLGTSIRKLEASGLDSIKNDIIVITKIVPGGWCDSAITALFSQQEVHDIGDFSYRVIRKQNIRNQEE